ncbi:MAG: UDP-N-acetylmuramoyl-L-alanyl-D-glutamate--2,6-diaminopimelate ligase [Cyclonatronaceae bacterium]
MMKLSSTEILQLCSPLAASGKLPVCTGVTADSRRVKPGYIFAAIDGYTADGHAFIPQAIAGGAAVILSERSIEQLDDLSPENPPALLQVSDIRATLSRLAMAFEGNPQREMKLAGITGTNGKTTVSTLVHQALTHLGYTCGLMGTVEQRIGTRISESRLTTGDPEHIAASLAGMKQAGCTHVVMEVSSHALDQKRTDALSFDVAAFTNLSHDHLDYHKTPEAYLSAKKRLFDGLDAKATAIINSDDAAGEAMLRDCRAGRIRRFGRQNGVLKLLRNDASGLDLLLQNEEEGGPETRLKSRLTGGFNASNLAAAWLVCRAFGVSARQAAEALSRAEGPKGRMQKISRETDDISVFVDYAHTPDALENVLSSLRTAAPEQPLSVVFGCGGDRDRSKRPEMGKIAATYAHHIYLTSDNPRSEAPEAIIGEIKDGIPAQAGAKVVCITARPDAISAAIARAEVSGIVLIAGKGHETYQEIHGKRHHMDDAELAASALRKRPSTQTSTSTST